MLKLNDYCERVIVLENVFHELFVQWIVPIGEHAQESSRRFLEW